MLAAGVRKLPAGLVQAHRAMELANEDVTMEMEHRTTYLATVGTLGPMIGLVGTVYGMIMSFRVIAQAGSSPQASELAEGISTALFATLEGIAISIPAIYFYALFRNRIARLSLEVGMMAEPLLEQFAPGVRMPAPGRARRRPGRVAVAAAACPPLRRQRGAGGRRRRQRGRAPAAVRRRPTNRSPTGPISGWRLTASCRVAIATSSPAVLNPNLTPLLDVVLQLITFFMMLIHFGSRLEGSTRAVRLPLAPAALPGSDLTFDRLVGRARRPGPAAGPAASRWTRTAAAAWWAEQAKLRTGGPRDPRATPGPPPMTCRPS